LLKGRLTILSVDSYLVLRLLDMDAAIPKPVRWADLESDTDNEGEIDYIARKFNKPIVYEALQATPLWRGCPQGWVAKGTWLLAFPEVYHGRRNPNTVRLEDGCIVPRSSVRVINHELTDVNSNLDPYFLLGGGDEDGGPPAKKVRLGKGLITSLSRLRSEEAPPAAVPGAAPGAVEDQSVLGKMSKYKNEAAQLFLDLQLNPDEQKLLTLAYYLIKYAMVAGYTHDSDTLLMFFLLSEGENWRAHQMQSFRYESGTWKMEDSLHITDITKSLLTSLSGSLIELSENPDVEEVGWTWAGVQIPIKQIFQTAKASPNGMFDYFTNLAKVKSDHLRISTQNKVWQAPWMARLADLVRSARYTLSRSGATKDVNLSFLKSCNTSKPRSKGVCFVDTYLDENWQEKQSRRENDCYCKVNYKLRLTDLDYLNGSGTRQTYRDTLDRFLRGMYFDNEPWFTCKLAMYARVCDLIFNICIPNAFCKVVRETNLQRHSRQ
jgi:hypothetical protein